METIYSRLLNLFSNWEYTSGMPKLLTVIILLSAIFIIAILSNIITRRIIIATLNKLVKRTKTIWDDIILERKIFEKLSRIVPILIIYFTIHIVFPNNDNIIEAIQKVSIVAMLIVIVMVVNAFLNAANDIYNATIGEKKKISIKSYIQVVKIALFIVVGILILSIVLNKEIGYFVTGLGAMTAVIMLVFKDSILGLVGGIQLTSNDMVRIGDWISMPARNADGTVIEVSLNTVKVQNFDNTISMIPTYALVTESFSNWRGMEESGGRRIKRSIILNMHSVKFCNDELLSKLRHYKILENYINGKQIEFKEYNDNINDGTEKYNGLRLTNIGVLRKYIELYLRNNNQINQDMTILVRQLEPTPNGIPMELYVFSKIKTWIEFEAVQADIFDHLLAVIPDFELSVFQNPTGDDFNKIIS